MDWLWFLLFGGLEVLLSIAFLFAIPIILIVTFFTWLKERRK